MSIVDSGFVLVSLDPNGQRASTSFVGGKQALLLPGARAFFDWLAERIAQDLMNEQGTLLESDEFDPHFPRGDE